MSDHDSEVHPGSPEGESLNGSFSSNGSDPGSLASMFDGSGNGPDVSFLEDLAKAMRTTAAAEQARDTELTEQRRQAHLDAIRAREALEAEDLRELAKEDVKGIDAWSDGEIKRIKLERERRIASRREQLQVRLEEHRMVIASEVDAVEAALASYRTETERFFDRLGSQTDPVEIARQAGTRPPFPALDEIGPQVETPVIQAYQATVADAPSHETPVYDIPMAAAITPIEPIEVAEPVEAIVEPVTVDAPPAVEAIEIAETVEPEPAIEAVDVPEPVAETVSAEAEAHSVVDPAYDPEHLVGVMDPVAGQVATEAAPWQPGVEAIGEPAVAGDQIDQAIGAVENAGETTLGGSEEPVTVGAEARVVMPRTTGAGSWLRWPNSSIDRSDPSR